MRKENEFGGMYYQMDFSRKSLETIYWALTDQVTLTRILLGELAEELVNTLNIIDRIEKELGIE